MKRCLLGVAFLLLTNSNTFAQCNTVGVGGYNSFSSGYATQQFAAPIYSSGGCNTVSYSQPVQLPPTVSYSVPVQQFQSINVVRTYSPPVVNLPTYSYNQTQFQFRQKNFNTVAVPVQTFGAGYYSQQQAFNQFQRQQQFQQFQAFNNQQRFNGNRGGFGGVGNRNVLNTLFDPRTVLSVAGAAGGAAIAGPGGAVGGAAIGATVGNIIGSLGER